MTNSFTVMFILIEVIKYGDFEGSEGHLDWHHLFLSYLDHQVQNSAHDNIVADFFVPLAAIAQMKLNNYPPRGALVF